MWHHVRKLFTVVSIEESATNTFDFLNPREDHESSQVHDNLGATDRLSTIPEYTEQNFEGIHAEFQDILIQRQTIT